MQRTVSGTGRYSSPKLKHASRGAPIHAPISAMLGTVAETAMMRSAAAGHPRLVMPGDADNVRIRVTTASSTSSTARRATCPIRPALSRQRRVSESHLHVVDVVVMLLVAVCVLGEEEGGGARAGLVPGGSVQKQIYRSFTHSYHVLLRCCYDNVGLKRQAANRKNCLSASMHCASSLSMHAMHGGCSTWHDSMLRKRDGITVLTCRTAC